MIDRCYVAAPKASEADGAPVKRDDRRSVDHKFLATPIELADRETRGLHSYDDAAVYGLLGGHARGREYEGGAEEHQPEPSHPPNAGRRGSGQLAADTDGALFLFRERSLLFPIALGIYGVVLLTNTSKHLSLNVASAVLLILSGLASIGFGVIRGRTIELFMRGGELWERASWTTIGAGWGGLLLTRVALIGIAAAIGAKLAASPTSIPLMLAITLGAQMLVERNRARAAGIPIAPSRRGRKRSRRRRA